MKTKRGLIILMTFLVVVMLVGCSKQQAIPISGPNAQALPAVEDTSEFVHSLPNIRDAVVSTYSSVDIYLTDVLANLGGSRFMNDPSAVLASKIREKSIAFGETLSSIDLIVSDFNSNKEGINTGRLSSADSDLFQTIDGKLARYTANKAKFIDCSNKLNQYYTFADLTVQRESAIKAFTSKLEDSGRLIESNKFDEAISSGQKARGDLLTIKNIDVQRNAMGIVALGSDTIASWDVHLEAMDLLISLWGDLKANNMDAAMNKAQNHANTFDRANKLGANEPSSSAQATMVDNWLKQNVEVCKGVLS